MIAQLLPSFNERVLEVDLYHPCLCKAFVDHTLDSGALSDLDDVWDILQWRKNDGEIAPTDEHEPLRADLWYLAHIKFADVRASPSQSIEPGRRNLAGRLWRPLHARVTAGRHTNAMYRNLFPQASHGIGL